jgi:hypothetical protein
MGGNQVGVIWHTRCGGEMRRGHVDGCGRRKAVGQCGWRKLCALHWDRSEVTWREVMMWGQM